MSLSETGEMEDDQSIVRKWEEMDIDILVKIFESFDIIELTSGIAHVCRVWRMAACDPFLWTTLDLTKLESYFIKIPLRPYVFVADQSDKFLTRLLKISLNLSQGNIRSLIFHFNLYLNDDQLTYIAERCPRLRRLVLPAWNRIKESGICKAIRMWKDLESLTMPGIENPPYLMEEISNNCNNFRELKIMGPCDVVFANTLVAFLPRLRILSLRCTVLLKEALLTILEGLKNLEVLNISHCLLIDSQGLKGQPVRARQLDKSILNAASRLREFLTCMNESCTLCERMMEDEGLMRWYRYEKGLWKQDEVASLSL